MGICRKIPSMAGLSVPPAGFCSESTARSLHGGGRRGPIVASLRVIQALHEFCTELAVKRPSHQAASSNNLNTLTTSRRETSQRCLAAEYMPHYVYLSQHCSCKQL